MKRIVCSLISLILIMSLGLTAFAAEAEQRVYDLCGYLSGEEAEELESEISELVDETGKDFVVVITDSKGGKSLAEYADDFYDEGGFGVGTDSSGILVLIDMEERTVYVSTSGESIKYFTDDRLYDMTDGNDDLYNELADGDYADAVEVMVDNAEYYYEKGIPTNQYTYDELTGEVVRHRSITILELVLALVVAAVIVISNVKSVKNQYSMKKEKKMAAGFNLAYRAAAAFAFAVATDNLVSHNTTTRRIPRTSESSGGSSGSSSGRSTIHTSSSGSSHGGGGGGRHF